MKIPLWWHNRNDSAFIPHIVVNQGNQEFDVCGLILVGNVFNFVPDCGCVRIKYWYSLKMTASHDCDWYGAYFTWTPGAGGTEGSGDALAATRLAKDNAKANTTSIIMLPPFTGIFAVLHNAQSDLSLSLADEGRGSSARPAKSEP